VNNNNEYAVGFSWRHSDGTTKRGNWLRDLAIALAIATAASLLCIVGDASAQQRTIQISGANRTAMVTVTIGKSQDVRTDASFVDVMVGDPEVAWITSQGEALGGPVGERRARDPGDGAREAARQRAEGPLEERRLELELFEVLGLHGPELGQAGLDRIDGRAADESEDDEEDGPRGCEGDDDGHRVRPRCRRSCG